MIVLIIIAGILIIPFWIRNKVLYNEGFGDALNGRLNLMLINMHNTICDVPGKPMFSVFENFFSYTANLITKFVIFIIVIIIEHFTNTFILVGIYILPVITDWMVYKNRKAFYNDMSSEYKKAYSTMYRACICSPLYQTILYLLLQIAFIFDI